MLDSSPDLSATAEVSEKQIIRVIQEASPNGMESWATAVGADVILEGRAFGMSKEVFLKDGVRTQLPFFEN